MDEQEVDQAQEQIEQQAPQSLVVLPYQECRKIERERVCGMCGGEITTVSGGAYGFAVGSHAIRCANDISHHGTLPRGKPEHRRFVDMSGGVAVEANRVYTNKGDDLHDGVGVTQALTTLKGIQALTQEQVIKALNLLYPNAPLDEALKAAMICEQYGLNPLYGHLFLVEYGGDYVPVISIKATRLIASRVAAKRGVRYSYEYGTPRVMSKDEQEKTLGEYDEGRIWAITTLSDGEGHFANGYGSFGKTEKIFGETKGNSRANMAFIRSERNAFDRLFPAEMPSDLEVVDDRYIPNRDAILEGRATLISEIKPERAKQLKSPRKQAVPVDEPPVDEPPMGRVNGGDPKKGKIREPQIKALMSLTKVETQEGLLREAEIKFGFGIKTIYDISTHDAATWIKELQGMGG